VCVNPHHSSNGRGRGPHVCVCVCVCVCVHAPMCDNVIGRSASEWMSELCLRVCRNQCLKVPGEVL